MGKKDEKVTCKQDILHRMNLLSKNEMKVMFIILSHIDTLNEKGDTSKKITINKNYIQTILWCTYNGFGKELRRITINLNTRLIYVEERKRWSKDEFWYFHWTWISSAINKLNSSEIEFEISSNMMKYFSEIQAPYVTILIKNILSLESKYGIGIYAMLRADEYKKIKFNHDLEYDVDDLINMFQLKMEYKFFKRDVLKWVIEDINKNSDIFVDYKEIKEWRRVEKIQFTIKQKPKIDLVDDDSVKITQTPLSPQSPSNVEKEIRERLGKIHISKKKIDELLSEFTHDDILKNIRYATKIIDSGYSPKSVSGYFLSAIKDNYDWTKQQTSLGFDWLDVNQNEAIEADKNIKIQLAKNKARDWWESLPKEEQAKLIEENKTWKPFQDLPEIVKSRILWNHIKESE